MLAAAKDPCYRVICDERTSICTPVRIPACCTNEPGGLDDCYAPAGPCSSVVCNLATGVMPGTGMCDIVVESAPGCCALNADCTDTRWASHGYCDYELNECVYLEQTPLSIAVRAISVLSISAVFIAARIRYSRVNGGRQ